MMRRLIRKGLCHCRRAVMRKKVVRRKIRLHWPVRARVTHATASGENNTMHGRKEGVCLLGQCGEEVGGIEGHRVKGRVPVLSVETCTVWDSTLSSCMAQVLC